MDIYRPHTVLVKEPKDEKYLQISMNICSSFKYFSVRSRAEMTEAVRNPVPLMMV